MGRFAPLIKYHQLAAKKHKGKWYVGVAYKEQVDWQPEQWQEVPDALR